jgi:hypothetical protein
MSVDRNRWSDLIELLGRVNVTFVDGLTDPEIAAIESKFGFRFPLDLRGFLQTALPKGSSFPDWRSEDDAKIRDWLSWPLDTMIFKLEHKEFWLPEWGQRPTRITDAKKIVERCVSKAPRLIPINGHGMMPDRPHKGGNPVFSVHQADIIYYGFNLDDYLRHEFCLPGRKPWPLRVQSIDFWHIDRWEEMKRA